MLEVSLMFENQDYKEKIFPVLLKDARIYSAADRAEYVIDWQNKVKELNKLIKEIENPTITKPLIDNLEEYQRINNVVAKFTKDIGDMHVLNAETLLETDCEILFKAIENQNKTTLSKIDLAKVSEENEKLKNNISDLKNELEKLKEEAKAHKDLTKRYEIEKKELEKSSKKELMNFAKVKDELEKQLEIISKDRNMLEIEVQNYRQKEKEIEEKRQKEIAEKEAEENKMAEAARSANVPYTVLGLKTGVSSMDIERQYQRLYNEYNQGYLDNVGSTKIAFKEALDKLQLAYNTIYPEVKAGEEQALKAAYDFMQLKPGSSSKEIKEKYETQKLNLQKGLKSSNLNIAKSAEADLKELDVHFTSLYNLIRKKEQETAPHNMVLVKGGKFIMGESPTSNNCASHEVEVSKFFIDQYPLLVVEYKEFCKNTNCEMPPPPSWGWHDDHPMVNISWYDALRYALWANKRLPTEAEWEFAARGGLLSKKFEFSGSNNLKEVGWYNENSKGTTKPVRELKPNELGIYEMSGQVREWCWDIYDDNYYNNSPILNPKGPEDGSGRVLRGGSFKVAAKYCKVFNRSYGNPYDRNETWGVRFVQDCL
jgi:sulfatase modifying factor 1